MSEGTDYCKTCFHPKGYHVGGLNCIGGDGRGDCGCVEYIHGETRVTNVTGASKGTKEERFDLIPIPALTYLARLYGKGALKYAEHNWRLGYEWSKSYAAAQRHMNAFWSGENIDPETQVPHVINAAFHMFALATYITEHPELDDRFETNQGAPKTSFQDILQAAFNDTTGTIGSRPDAIEVEFAPPSDSPEPPSREYLIEESAQWVAKQEEGVTITFDPSFTEEERNRIFLRAQQIEAKRNSTDEKE